MGGVNSLNLNKSNPSIGVNTKEIKLQNNKYFSYLQQLQLKFYSRYTNDVLDKVKPYGLGDFNTEIKGLMNQFLIERFKLNNDSIANYSLDTLSGNYK